MAYTAAYGVGPPNSSVNPVDVYYVATDTDRLYGPRTTSGWPLHAIQLPVDIPATPNVLVNSDPPNPSDGSVGSFFVDTSTEQVYGPKTSSGWGVGLSYTPTYSGIRFGSGPPNDNDGLVGDQYIDTTNNVYYGPKTSSGWPAGVNIKGDQGEQGPQGNPGVPGFTFQGLGNVFFYGSFAPNSGMGREGDLYLDTSTRIIYGPKLRGFWPVLGRMDDSSSGWSLSWLWIFIIIMLLIAIILAVWYFWFKYRKV